MMVSVEDAHRIIQTALLPPVSEEVLLDQLLGRVLAVDITASCSLPRFTNAAMDGFAVQWQDIEHASQDSPARLQVTQQIPAGLLSPLAVVSGGCAEIMTGAPLPEGADTVVAFEDTSGFGSPFVDIFRSLKPGANVRYGGEEVVEGERLLCKGESVSPAHIAVLASFGYASAAVQQKPRVSIVTVGDELRLPGEKVSGAEIYNCNLFMLAAACRSIGIDPVGLRHVADDRKLLRDVLAHSLAECDLLITVGGISTGEYDFVQEELYALGVQKKFWKVAQKPGKPLYFGSAANGKPVFSLPGNPVSALVCFIEYCLPALCGLQGKALPDKLRATLTEPFPCDKKRHRFLLGTVWLDKGQLLCKTTSRVESHMITSLTGSNCLLEAGASSEPLVAGSGIDCSMLPWASLHQ
jgi:molybdopterin molybdotransferase